MAPETTQVDERGPVLADGAAGPGDAHAPDADAVTVSVERALGDPDRLARVERALLEARIAALERTVEHKDKQLQEIVDRYEQVLAERERKRRAETDRSVGEVEIEFEDETDESRVAVVGRWVRTALDWLRR